MLARSCSRVQAKGTNKGLHTAHFKLDETVLGVGAAYHAALAMEFLGGNGKVGAGSADEL